MKYERSRFTIMLGEDEKYRDNFDKIFRKKEKVTKFVIFDKVSNKVIGPTETFSSKDEAYSWLETIDSSRLGVMHIEVREVD